MDNGTKKQCLADFLNVPFDRVFESEGFFYHEAKVFVIATAEEAMSWSKVQLMQQLYQFSLDLFMPYLSVKTFSDIEIDQNYLKSAFSIVFKYGSNEEKQAFILQMLEPSELEKFIKNKLKEFKDSDNGFAPFLSSDGKQHYSRQYNLYLYRYND